MTHYQLVATNKFKSWLVMAGFMVFVSVVAYALAWALGGDSNVWLGMALIFTGVSSFVSYWYSDRMILAISGAKPAKRDEWFDFYTVAENIASGQQLPVPKLYVLDDTSMNAFATGRDPKHAVVCATTGLLTRLNRSEVEGVVAHELSHVRNYDTLLMSIVATLVGSIVLITDWVSHSMFWGAVIGDDDDRKDRGPVGMIVLLVVIVVAPIVGTLIQLAISRRREFLADADAVAMTKNPEGLIKALTKLSQDKEPLEAANKATAHLYIVNPLANLNKDARGSFANLFATHPPMTQRIAALQSIAT